MKKCKNCSKSTRNPKFCSRSCSATYSNFARGRREMLCNFCSISFHPKEKGVKFCSTKCYGDFRKQEKINSWYSGEFDGTIGSGTNSTLSRAIRNHLLEESDHSCTECGWREFNRHTNTCPLEVDHIDGDYTNNRPENLRVICPNCHSLKATHRGANRRKVKNSRFNGGRS